MTQPTPAPADASRQPSAASSGWLTAPTHRAWLISQCLELLDFFLPTVDEDGSFVELNDDGVALRAGHPPGEDPRQQLLTVTRAVHCYAIAELLGVPGASTIVQRGVTTLWGEHRDAVAGGYFTAVGRGGGAGDTSKTAYGHVHVLLAAAAALAAGHQAAAPLLDDALAQIDEHFWSEAAGAMTVEDYDAQWHEIAPYRGVNSNMHLCESLLAAAEVTGRSDLAERALRLVAKFIDGHARAHDWLLPEHYDASWAPMLEHNHDRPGDPFRPYGATIGHSLEWSRLVLNAGLASGELSGSLVEMSQAMFARGVGAGWDRGWGGIVYTVDWDGTPFNRDRYWWPIAEGIATSSYLLRITSDPVYETWYRRFWDFAASHLLDRERGGWYAMLDEHGTRKAGPWYGKPDVYHTLQAHLLPLLPVAPSLIGAVRRSQYPDQITDMEVGSQ